MYTGEFPLSQILTFPLGVLEIKLHDTPPDWVTSLVKSGYLIRAEMFSKFQHSMGILYHDKISTPPDWFDNPIVRVNATGTHGWYNIGVPFTNAQTNLPLNMSELRTNLVPENRRPTNLSLDLETLLNETLVGIPVSPINPKQKFDPGFFLANERIFLKWTRFMVTFSALAVLFLSRPSVYSKLSGSFLLMMALACGIYGLVTHRLRKTHWEKKTPFTDPVGLSFLVVLVLVSILLVTFVSMVFGSPLAFSRMQVIRIIGQ